MLRLPRPTSELDTVNPKNNGEPSDTDSGSKSTNRNTIQVFRQVGLRKFPPSEVYSIFQASDNLEAIKRCVGVGKNRPDNTIIFPHKHVLICFARPCPEVL